MISYPSGTLTVALKVTSFSVRGGTISISEGLISISNISGISGIPPELSFVKFTFLRLLVAKVMLLVGPPIAVQPGWGISVTVYNPGARPQNS